jgi:hypothetical protein
LRPFESILYINAPSKITNQQDRGKQIKFIIIFKLTKQKLEIPTLEGTDIKAYLDKFRAFNDLMFAYENVIKNFIQIKKEFI